MLTDLSWLENEGVYPPKSEKKRIDRYILNEKLFLSEHTEALSDIFHDIARQTHKKHYDADTIINYQQLLSKKTADFVCGEPPSIESEQNTDDLVNKLNKQYWNLRLYEAFIDISRYGNAVLKFVGKNITAVAPQYWFPILDSYNLKNVKQHVIAYPVNNELYVEIHNKGSIETRVYSYNNGKIGELKSSTTASTGLDDFAVQILSNVSHSGSVYGVDDYTAINSIVSKIMWRLYCVDTVLDKHSEPSLSGPSSALTYDNKFKTYFLDLGNYFQRNSTDDPDLKYITWDGNLDAAYKEIDLLLDQLYTISEMGQAFMEGDSGGAANSGTALKLRMVSPRIKAARLSGINEQTIKQIITMFALLNGIPLDYDGLTLHWKDGLPNDEVEQINTLVTATGGKAVMSQYAAMKRLGLSDTEVEAEMEQLEEEQASSAPVMLGTVTADE